MILRAKLVIKREAFKRAPKCSCGRACEPGEARCWACGYDGPTTVPAVE